MYLIPEMLDMTGVIWSSEAHRQVAVAALISNPRYTTLPALTEGAKIISKIPQSKIKLVTMEELVEMGVQYNDTEANEYDSMEIE